MHHPLLRLGLLGFSAQQRETVTRFLAENSAAARERTQSDPDMPWQHPVWVLSDYREANALLICAAPAHEGEIQLEAHDAYSPLAVKLADLVLPYAVQWLSRPADSGFVSPVQPASDNKAHNVSTAHEINIDSAQSLVKTLRYFEASLRPLRTLFALAEQMMERRSELDDQHVFHLTRSNMLDCIVDLSTSRLMVRDGMRPVDVYDTAWQSRPLAANTLPPGFSVWSMEEVAWLYGLHRPTIALPKRYMQSPVYFRRLPRVRSSLLQPRHTNLIELLGSAALTYQQLGESLDIDGENLERDLYSLYLCRAITTRSHKGAMGQDSDAGNSSLFFRPPSIGTNTVHDYTIETVTGHLI